jgi:hypothetical protein
MEFRDLYGGGRKRSFEKDVPNLHVMANNVVFPQDLSYTTLEPVHNHTKHIPNSGHLQLSPTLRDHSNDSIHPERNS